MKLSLFITTCQNQSRSHILESKLKVSHINTRGFQDEK